MRVSTSRRLGLIVSTLSASALLAACTDDGPAASTPGPGVGVPSERERITPEAAGFGDATPVPFSHYAPPAGCVLDAEGRAATCDVSGCTVPDRVLRIDAEPALAALLSCEGGASPSIGVSFAESHVLFVRQGTRTGEWMRPEPVAWVVDAGDAIVVAEMHEVFCLGGADINGGVVSYAIVLPASTSSRSIDRRIYRDPNGCEVCSEEADCAS